MVKVTEQYEENKTKDQLVTVQCIRCAKETRHKVLQSVDYFATYSRGYKYLGEDVANYQIIQCQGCVAVTFRKLSYRPDEIFEIGDGEWEGFEEDLYPKRSKFTLPPKDFSNVPNNLTRIYRETIECFNNDSFTLSAAGLRALVEGLCAELNIKNGPKEVEKNGVKIIKIFKDLEGKIAGLYEKGYLTQQHSNVLHEHRYLGNQAVHELSQPTRDELVLAIEIIEHTFESVYEIPQKAHDLQNRRAKRNKST